MFHVFGHYVRWSVLLLGVAEFLCVGVAFHVISMGAFGGDVGAMALAFGSALLLVILMFALGLYEPIARFNLRVLVQRLALTCLIAACAVYLIYSLYDEMAASTMHSAAAGVLAFASVFALRMGYGAVTQIDAFKRRVLVVGVGWRAEEVARLCHEPGAALRFVGHIRPARRGENKEEVVAPESRVVGATDALLATALEEGVAEIVVALEERRGVLPTSELLACRMHGVTVSDYSTFVERESGKVDLDNVYPSWLVFSDGFRSTVRALAAKRAIDVVGATLLLIVTAPLLALAAVAIRLDSPGSVFYRQTRVGFEGRGFEILKFRSMRADAEKDGARWAAENDPRVTRVGHFIRRTRIDELPQLWNVLAGDMSFVGPRPERPHFVKDLAAKIPYYNDRHRIKPGITGWAQINYPYGASIEDAKEKLKYDLYYMKNCSLFLDFIILLKTLRVVLWPDGVR